LVAAMTGILLAPWLDVNPSRREHPFIFEAKIDILDLLYFGR
jgi:hypothetical protein